MSSVHPTVSVDHFIGLQVQSVQKREEDEYTILHFARKTSLTLRTTDDTDQLQGKTLLSVTRTPDKIRLFFGDPTPAQPEPITVGFPVNTLEMEHARYDRIYKEEGDGRDLTVPRYPSEHEKTGPTPEDQQ